MARSYTQLTLGERKRIKELRLENRSIGFIARALSRAKSTISRELHTNGSDKGYNPRKADVKARIRRSKPRRPAIMVVRPDIASLVKDGLRLQWSPEQIAGRMRQSRRTGLRISHQSIYRWLWQDKRDGGTWYRHLRLDNRKRKKQRGGRGPGARIANRTMIDRRPVSVISRRYLGDWEADTIQGKHGSGRLATLVERKSRYTVMAYMGSKHSEVFNTAVLERIRMNDDLPFRTITVDNGLEFAGHAELSTALNCSVYFAHPYHSWERGLNENTNGLIRQYFPKGTEMRSIPMEMVAQVENLLNNRPRKTLGYRTPAEVMETLLRRRRGVRLRT